MYEMLLLEHPENNHYFINGFSGEDLKFLSFKHLYSKHMFNDGHFPFPSNTAPSPRYVFPIRSDKLGFFAGEPALKELLTDFSFTIPDRVINDVRANRCKILIDNSIESYDVIVTDYMSIIKEIIIKTIKKYDLKKTDVILLTANYRTRLSNDFLVAVKNWGDTRIRPCDNNFFNLQKNLILSKAERPKKILTFMRKERSFRFHFAKFIYDNNLKEDNIVTFGKNVSPYYWDNNSIQFPSEFISSLPWEYDIDLKNNKNFEFMLARSEAEINAYLETYINYVVERSITYLDYELDISEKIFKPIAFLQPFVVFGQPGSLEFLKSLGFKSFDRWWDESYDSIKDEQIRFRAITSLYKKLSRMTKLELAEIMYEAWPVLEHNYYNYCDYIKTGKSDQNLLKIIKESFDK